MAAQAPPPYNPGYGQPQPGYPPGQAYPPPQQGYPPPQQGYPPPQQAAQQQQSNVVVVTQQAAPTVITQVRDNRPNHLLHCIITFFCPIWIFVWIIVCCVYGC